MFNRYISTAFAASMAVIGATGAASAETDMPFALDWKFEGPAAPYFLAVDSGLFADADLSVEISEGKARSTRSRRSPPAPTRWALPTSTA